MFIDEITLTLKAGRGGDGVVRWLHEKGKDRGGPAGGNGGRGGHVYALGVRDLGVLSSYRKMKGFSARDGDPGQKNSKHGADGDDVSINFPVGSRLENLTTGHVIEILKEGEKILLLRGGRGGLGNEHFKSSTNVTPYEYTEGEEGESADFRIELLLVVDVGLIGLPNAGKSSLLNVLTGARSKVGAFPFTTLEPSLGSLYGVILADIPGLIEGASDGKGLGHKFLKHIERTKTLLHLVSAEEPDPLLAWRIVRKELELYNKTIVEKPETILLTKTDLISKEQVAEKINQLKEVRKNVFPISILEDVPLKNLKQWITS